MTDHPGISKHECSIPIAGGNRFVFPNAETSPDGASYVRFVDENGEEWLYYDCEEWEEDPKLVMGAICAALLNGADGLRQEALQRNGYVHQDEE